MSYPIIFADEGNVMDGTYRIAKAHALGLPSIKRFRVTPEPDERRPKPLRPET